jgi:hypothetical protein
VVVVGPTPGQEFPLLGDHFTMGRAEDASISINHSSVSRYHAEIFALGNGKYEIIDKNSANGIRVNGHELKRGIFEAGDAIELGDVRLRFVGAGKIFRAGFDRSQQLAAMKGFDSVSPASMRPVAAAKPPSGLGKWIGIGVVLGLLGVAGVLFALRGGTTPVAPAAPSAEAPKQEDAGAPILKQAVALVGEAKLQEAHDLILTIPEDSPSREAEAFADIEAKWADWMFEKVAATEDTSEKRQLLHRIAKTDTVDAVRRRKAADMIRELDPSEPDPLASGAAAPHTGPAAPPQPGAPPTAPAGGNAPTPPPAKSAAPPAPASTDTRDQALSNPEGTMNALISKMAAGNASEQELRLLRGLCTQLNNRSCRAAANAALKALENK